MKLGASARWHTLRIALPMNGQSLTGDLQSVSEIVRRLANYWRANPHAGDTQEGISQWWLGLTPSSTERVDMALRWMQSRGLVEAVQASDGRVHYRRVSLEARIDMQLDTLISELDA